MTTAIGSYVTSTLLKTRANITDNTDDTVLGTICDQINQYIEDTTSRVMAPISSATYKYDGHGERCLRLARPSVGPPIGGLRAISLLELQMFTGAGYVTIDSSQYFLRDSVMMTGPYQNLYFTDFPTGSFAYFPQGFETVRITATAGWAAIPDSIAEVAAVAAVRAWHAAQSGQTDIVGTDDMGKPLVSRFFSARDLETLGRYSLDTPA